jgi:hypothetical protein
MVKWYRLIICCEVLLVAMWPFFTFFVLRGRQFQGEKGRKRGPQEAGGVAPGKRRGRGPAFPPATGKPSYFPGLFSVFTSFELGIAGAGKTALYNLPGGTLYLAFSLPATVCP